MDVTKAIRVIDELVLAREGRHLEEPEKIVIEAAWLDVSYEEIKENTPYDLALLQRRVAPRLWVLLTGILGSGEKVTKKRLRIILEQRMELSGNQLDISYTGNQLDAFNSSQPKASQARLKIIGGQPPDTSSFYGRANELKQLKEVVNKQRCIVLTGAAGIGKSALAGKLVEIISAKPQFGFNCLIWKSLTYAPSLEVLVTELIELLAPLETELPEYSQAKVSLLLRQMQSRRCLVVLDAAEVLLEGSSFEQRMEYRTFFLRLVEEQHQSCLLLTSRVPFEELDVLVDTRPVQALKVAGLEQSAALQLLIEKGLSDSEQCFELIQTYRGNPAELEAVANRINHFFAGNADKFIEYRTTCISPRVQAMLNQLFSQTGLLSQLQRQILIYLAQELTKNPAPINLAQLLNSLSQRCEEKVSTSELMVALEGLESRSLIESIKNLEVKEIAFILPPVVSKYILTDPLGLVQKASMTVKSA